MLLMFGVGLHFSLRRPARRPPHRRARGHRADRGGHRARDRRTAMAWGWPAGAALVFGLALSVASTVVLLRALEDRGVLESVNGRIAVGWLVVEDLAMVLVLVLLPAAGRAARRQALARPVRRRSSGRLWRRARDDARQGRRVRRADAGRRAPRRSRGCSGRSRAPARASSSRSACSPPRVGVAYGSAQLFGVSFALGAFFAGMMMRESEFSHRAAEESLPLRDAFAVLFFVSVGMLFDPRVLVDEPLQRARPSSAIIMVGKTLAAFALVLAFRYPAQHGAHGGGEPRADRRVLVHPRRPRRGAGPAARAKARASFSPAR